MMTVVTSSNRFGHISLASVVYRSEPGFFGNAPRPSKVLYRLAVIFRDINTPLHPRLLRLPTFRTGVSGTSTKRDMNRLVSERTPPSMRGHQQPGASMRGATRIHSWGCTKGLDVFNP